MMLSQQREGGQVLGEQYCPDQPGTWCLGPFLITTTDRREFGHYTLGDLSVQVQSYWATTIRVVLQYAGV